MSVLTIGAPSSHGLSIIAPDRAIAPGFSVPDFLTGTVSDLRFARGLHRINGRQTLPPVLDAHQGRSTSRWVQKQDGSWLEYDAGENAIPVGIGYVSGEAFTNALPNPLAAGGTNGIRGTDGVLPTGWSQATVSGITVTLTAVTRYGLPGLRVKMQGTNTSGAAAFPHIYLTASTQVAAAQNETWTFASTIELLDATDLSGLSSGNIPVGITEIGSGGGGLATFGTSTERADSPGRHDLSYTRTLTNAAAAHLRPFVDLGISAGGTADFVFEVIAPRLVLAGFDPGFGVGATGSERLVIPAAALGMNVTPSVTGITAVWRGRTQPTGVSQFPRMFSLYADTGNRMTYSVNNTAGQYLMSFSSGNLHPGHNLGTNSHEEHTVAVTWDPGGAYAVASTLGPTVTGTNPMLAGALTGIGIGCEGNGANQLNGEHRAFAVAPFAADTQTLEGYVQRMAA